MAEFRFRKGLDIPIEGKPEQVIYDHAAPTSVAVIGADFVDIKPRMAVEEGAVVRRGDVVFTHKDSPDVLFTAPASGRVRAINRGARRVLQSVVIDVDDIADPGLEFGSTAEDDMETITRDEVLPKLCKSGLWTAFRERPYSKVPHPSHTPAAIFVTAMDTEPLAPDAALIIHENATEFEAGLWAVATLTDGKTYVCKSPGQDIPVPVRTGIEVHAFKGPHPAGLAGTHMHFLEPPSTSKNVWSIGYQDVIAIGRTFLTGHLDCARVVSIAGPRARDPRLVRTWLGASIAELTEHSVTGPEPCRIIDGSVLSGRQADGPFAYIGRYSRQITLITEDREQTVLGWITPQPNKFSALPVLASAANRARLFNITSNLNGGRRAMVPTGLFEELMPQDYLPTQLLRALLVKDTDTAQALGALELDEEDLALCTFACPAKYEYGEALRSSLHKIEKEG